MKFDWLKAADPKLEVAPSCRARGLKLVSKSLCHSHADGRALMKGAGIEIGFGPLRSAPSALRVQQNEVLAVLTAWDDVFSRSGAVFPGRGRVSSGVLPRCRLGCEDSSCQNLVFAAHRLEETREPARRHEATTRRGAIRAAFPEGSPRIPRGARASRKIVRRSPRARATRKVCYYGQVMFSPVPPSVFERYARSRCVKTREGKQAL